jgi:lipopolysaccharide/colanic/teichoic acid biosynthesis glycosyltransferase
MEGSKGKKPRVTALGKWLRKYRVDEIPQLLNVMNGDMSLIGPRPEIPFFVERCQNKIPFYSATFAVKPGLTGWAQVKFRHTISEKDYERKFCYNLYYLKNISPQLDLEILIKTVRIVLLGRGV